MMFSLGSHTLSVPMTLFANNRKRLCDKLKATVSENAIVLLQGGQQLQQDSTDRTILFRQESYFQWCFGVTEPDCFGIIEVASGKAVLFIPKLPKEYQVWMGEIYPPSHFQAKYAVDDVKFVQDLPEALKAISPQHLLTLDKGLKSHGQHEKVVNTIQSSFTFDNEILQSVMDECRVVKSEEELNVMRYVSRVSSDAHIELMRRIRPGWMEYQAESLFRHLVHTNGGCRQVFYDCVASSGPRCAIMNYATAYFPNDKVIEDGTLCLFDMSGEYCCYGSDITCTFPVNGKFTADQKAIYNIVLKANRAVRKAMKPGISLVDLHLLAERIFLEGLMEMGIIHGDIDDMVNSRLGAIFMPFGVGHFVGLDLLDVGGYPKNGPPPRTERGLDGLHTTRNMEAGMVITIEPGLYFNKPLVKDALNDPEFSRFIDEKAIQRFMDFGGVRIEEIVTVTSDGIEVLSCIPRDVDEIERLMAEGRANENPVLRGNLLPNVKA